MLAFCKKITTMLLLLAYAGQSLAALMMPCNMHDEANTAVMIMHDSVKSMPATAEHEHGAMSSHHDMHHATAADASASMGSEESTTEVLADCCGALGHCLMSGCSVHVAHISSLVLPDAVKTASSHQYTAHRPALPASHHFRPPIFS